MTCQALTLAWPLLCEWWAIDSPGPEIQINLEEGSHALYEHLLDYICLNHPSGDRLRTR
jgi:hypothetical protein